ncbi:hypothetical protein [Bacillus amyloliquefaciens]|uniref:hypothetical protein n=1 Tax=Bacillus subtilis group TaxID=653685 RepID=UPI0005F089CA|nr:hypothetical protein [Bacillus amyloliquefaciens]
MELVLRGALSTKDREYIMGFHNGHTIAEVIDKLYKDGLTREVRVIGHMDVVSYVITQYAAYIIEDGHTLRLKADDLRHLTYVITEMKKEKDRV